MKLGRLCSVFFLQGLLTLQLLAGEILAPHRTTFVPAIDGYLDDSTWIGAPHVTGFKTFAPDFGEKVVEQTDVAMSYDNENLYFAIRCFDPNPDKIKTSISSRDNILADDWFCLNLDSFGDQQGLYAFYVNPAGIQADSRSAAGREDFSLDYVWFSAGKMDSAGYTLEIQVPLKSIRYADSNPAMMSVIFERYISRRSEHSSYPELDPAKGLSSFVTQMEPIEYYEVKHYTLLEILPAVTFHQRFLREGEELVKDDQKGELGLTMKYGITANLILDGTYNPDFSQVESDAGQVDINLRYSLYFPEKRPFFLEGRDNFAVAATEMSGYENIDPVIAIIHTRTIADPLLGVKVSGKLGNPSTIASLYAIDNVLEADRDSLGRYAHIPIVRYKLALSDDSYFGGIFAGQEFEHGSNNVVGFDNQIRLSKAGLFESSGFVSEYSPGASVTEMGHTVGARYSYDNRDIGHSWTFREISEKFRADMGFITRTGIVAFTGSVRPKFYPPSDLIQRIVPEVYSAQTMDEFSDLWETYNHLLVSMLFRGNLSLSARAIYATEIYQGIKFQTGGFVTSFSGQATNELRLSLSYANKKAVYYDSLYQGRSQKVAASLLFQPSEKIQAEGSFIYSDFFRESDGVKMYDYPISRVKLTYQANQYLFFRGIGEYNNYYKELSTDFLASFMYIPGTVLFLGYGSLFDDIAPAEPQFANESRFVEVQRGFFFKASYLWRI